MKQNDIDAKTVALIVRIGFSNATFKKVFPYTIVKKKVRIKFEPEPYIT